MTFLCFWVKGEQVRISSQVWVIFFFLWYWLQSHKIIITLKGPGILCALPAPWLLRENAPWGRIKQLIFSIYAKCLSWQISQLPLLLVEPEAGAGCVTRCTISKLQYRWSFPPVCLAKVVTLLLSNCGCCCGNWSARWVLCNSSPSQAGNCRRFVSCSTERAGRRSYTGLKAQCSFKTLVMAFAHILSQLTASQHPCVCPPHSRLSPASSGRGSWKLFQSEGVTEMPAAPYWLQTSKV